MRENNELTQFSIYKINIEKVEETILLKEDDKYKEVLLKCISENEKIKKDYEQWWEEVITKYNLNKYQSESLYVDYTQKCIQLNDI